MDAAGNSMDSRELRALELAARARIVWDDGAWIVPSQSTTGVYRVTTWPGAEKCPCEDFTLTGRPCKHIIAAKLVEERDGGRKAPTMDMESLPAKKTYKQNWPAYDAAQRVEKHRLQVLLAELCGGVPEPAYAGVGRRSHPITDRVFSVAFKVYSAVSGRRFACDLADAREKGYLSSELHPSKVSAFFCDPDLTAPLRELVERSALPLRAIESDFAVDSSGFSTCKFIRWFDEKYGVERSGHDWVKVHICVGVKTGVVTAIEIRDRDAHDSPILPPLVRTTAANFKLGEVSADKGYLAASNVDAIVELGGTPFIAPKANTTGAIGGTFQRMYHFYSFRRDEFLAAYHKRSNVESVFSAVKRKFGDSVRAKNQTAMVNEVLAKFLCNNLTAVILSQIELGIDADFWPTEGQDDAPRDVLRMPMVAR